MSDPAVAVFMPTYNQAGFIGQAVHPGEELVGLAAGAATATARSVRFDHPFIRMEW